MRALVGARAIDYVLVLGAFHFINRIADLLDVDSEALPERLRGFEPLRRFSVWMAARIMRRMDLRGRSYGRSYEQALSDIGPFFERAVGRLPGDAFEPVQECPRVLEVLRLALEERDARSKLDGTAIARIHRVVEEALPAEPLGIEGSRGWPTDPTDAFVFVGTRYAARATREMVDRLRAAGYDDLAVLDLAIAVADANQWARLYRLLGLGPEIFYLAEADKRAGHAVRRTAATG